MRKAWTKADIANHLADTRGYRSYLELCTATTGHFYAAVDRAKFTTCHRLMYRCPAAFDDGMPIDFRSPDDDLADCLARIAARGLRYDVILVDPWHEYASSRRAIEAARGLLHDRGTIIVHDCLPPSRELASPVYVVNEWCGVTYKAYLDFVLAHPDFDYFTINTDYGCGVIRRRGNLPPAAAPAAWRRAVRNLMRWRGRPDEAALLRDWRALGDDFDTAFRLLQRHKTMLLKLVSVGDFRRRLA